MWCRGGSGGVRRGNGGACSGSGILFKTSDKNGKKQESGRNRQPSLHSPTCVPPSVKQPRSKSHLALKVPPFHVVFDLPPSKKDRRQNRHFSCFISAGNAVPSTRMTSASPLLIRATCSPLALMPMPVIQFISGGGGGVSGSGSGGSGSSGSRLLGRRRLLLGLGFLGRRLGHSQR